MLPDTSRSYRKISCSQELLAGFDQNIRVIPWNASLLNQDILDFPTQADRQGPSVYCQSVPMYQTQCKCTCGQSCHLRLDTGPEFALDPLGSPWHPYLGCLVLSLGAICNGTCPHPNLIQRARLGEGEAQPALTNI